MKIFEKAKQAFNKLTKKTNEYWYSGRYIHAILTLLLPSVGVGLAVVLLILTTSAVFDFLRRHYAQLIMAALAVWAFLAWWDKHKGEQIRLERESQDLREREAYTDRLDAARTEDATYTTQGKVIFSVARELGALGVIPPATLNNIYSPGRMIPRAKGTVTVSLFLLQKDRESVDTDLLKHTLQTRAILKNSNRLTGVLK